MSNLEKIQNVNRIITDKFPKLNNQFVIESSIESNHTEIFFPINEFKQDSVFIRPRSRINIKSHF